MKKLLILFAVPMLLTASCTTIRQVGDLNMISTRNVESKANYVLIKNYATNVKKDKLKNAKSETIDEAINETVKSCPGGEFLKNVKVYSVNGRYFAIEGDVWGFIDNQQFKGFKVGSKVTWKQNGSILKGEKERYETGSIKSFIDNATVLIQVDNSKTITEKKLTDITILNQ